MPAKVATDTNPVPGGGPVDASLAAGALPSRAASMAGSLPSIPRAQIPTPAMWKKFANCALRAIDVGSSKNVVCHWVPTW